MGRLGGSYEEKNGKKKLVEQTRPAADVAGDTSRIEELAAKDSVGTATPNSTTSKTKV